MSSENANNDVYFGIPIEEYPVPCQTCQTLAELVGMLGNPDLTEQPLYPLPDPNHYSQIARMVFPYLDMCSAESCGVENAHALQRAANLE